MSPSRVRRAAMLAILALGALGLAGQDARGDHEHVSGRFAGPKVNEGTVTHVERDGASVLTLSPDFEVPDAPAPHWQVVDSHGNVYLLQRLLVKGDRLNGSIALPPYIKDVVKVQIWCAFAETLLGEASFTKPVG